MPRLPNADSLGQTPIPQSRRSITSSPATGVIGQAVEGLGKAVSGVANDLFERQDKAQYAAAGTAYLKAHNDALATVEHDPDPGTAADRYRTQMGKTREAVAATLANRADRSVFEAQAATDIERGVSAVHAIAQPRIDRANLTAIDNGAGQNKLLYAQAQTPDDRTRAVNLAGALYDSAVQRGLIDAPTALKLKQAWVSDARTSRIFHLLDTHDVAGAEREAALNPDQFTSNDYNRVQAAVVPAVRERRLEGLADTIEAGHAYATPGATTAGAAAPGTETRRVVSGKVRIDGHGTPVTDAASILRATYPGARMTDNVRDPHSKLGQENPGSYHVQTHAAIDVAPIQGMTFDQYAQGFRDKGYTIIEAREETGAGRSRHATGDHWHIVLGQPGSTPAARQAPDYGATDAPGMVSAGNIDLANRRVVHNADGSISTEQSFSIGTDKGEVLIPLVVGGKVLSEQQAVAHYRKTGENLGTFATPDAADAYAQALHEKQGQRYSAASGENAAPGARDLGGQLAAVDRLDIPPEDKMELKNKLRGRAALTNQIREQGYQDAEQAAATEISKIGPDNFTSIAQLSASVRSALKPTDYLRLQTSAQSNANERATRGAALSMYSQMTATPGAAWNVYDPNQRKAVEAAVEARGGTPLAAFDVWQKTGILAKTGAVALRGGLVSVDPAQVGVAANVAGNMLRHNPNAFAGVEGREDIEKAAVAFNHYTYDLGMTPQQAAARVAKENDPAFKVKIHLGQPERDQFKKTMRQQGLSAAQALGGQFYSTSQAQEADQTYAEMTLMAMDRGADLSTAQAQAKAQMMKVYGVTRDGHVTKYAPERGYPAVNGSHDYVYRDAVRTVIAETHLTAKQITDVHLAPIPGVTDQDFRANQPPRYQLLYGHMVDGQKVYNIVPGQWAADVNGATSEATRANEQNFHSERANRDRRVARLNPSGRVRPETGPGSNPLEDQ